LREEASRKRLTEAVDSQVRQARKEIDEIVAQMKARAAALANAPRLVSTGDTGSVRGDARAALDAAGKRALKATDATGSPPSAPGNPQSANLQSANPQSAIPNPQLSVGDRVIVGGLGLEATVTGLHDGTADLDVRGKRMRASVRDLRLLCAGSGAQEPAKVRVHVDLQPRDGATVDLNVIGCTVDEAISRAERFLDESLLSDQRVVRVIHGYGTGQLKRALTGFLQQHPLVARFATAPPEQGGGGVTVVELKD